jgi:hypothetical protein
MKLYDFEYIEEGKVYEWEGEFYLAKRGPYADDSSCTGCHLSDKACGKILTDYMCIDDLVFIKIDPVMATILEIEKQEKES